MLLCTCTSHRHTVRKQIHNWLMGVVLKLTLHSNHSVHSCLVTKGIFKLCIPDIHLSTVGGCNAAPWFHFLIRVNSERKLVVMMVWTGC